MKARVKRKMVLASGKPLLPMGSVKRLMSM